MKCSADPACVFPATVFDSTDANLGKCAVHARDNQQSQSLTSSTLQMFSNIPTYDWRAKYGSLNAGKGE